MIASSPLRASSPPMPSITPNISSRISLSALGSAATFNANGSVIGSRRCPRARTAIAASSRLALSALSSRNLTATGPPTEPIAFHIDGDASFSLAFSFWARAINAVAPLLRAVSSPTLPSRSAAIGYDGTGSPSTSASMVPLSGPIAVSTFSIECRPLRRWPVRRSFGDRRQQRAVDLLLLLERRVGTYGKERIARRQRLVGRRILHRDLVGRDQRLQDLGALAGGNLSHDRLGLVGAADVDQGRRRLRPQPGRHRRVGQRLMQAVGPLLGRLPELDIVGSRLRAADRRTDDRQRDHQREHPAKRQRPHDGSHRRRVDAQRGSRHTGRMLATR